MTIEIVSPEAILLQSEVTSVYLPGINGDFEMLNNHAPIVSLLKKGTIKIQGKFEIDEAFQDKFIQGKKEYTYLEIESGTIEMSDNKVIILID